MSERKLKTAVLGLDDRGLLLLEAAGGLDYYQIQAVADNDTKLTETTAEQYQCAGYDDYRQLIIQNQFDCLLVAAGMHSCAEYVRTAMKKQCNILKIAPPARDFEQARKFVRLAEDQKIKFAVANTGRFARSYLDLQRFLQAKPSERVFLITAFCALGDSVPPAWQTDQKLSGGGILLRDCYEVLDQMILNFGVPEQIYSLNTNAAGNRQQRQYLTEDTVVVTMKFTDTFFGNLIASRYAGTGPQQYCVKVYTRDRILTVSRNRFTASDVSGQTTDSEYDDDQLSCMRKVLENFALSIISHDKNKLSSSAEENLRHMAVIDSAYLSARTGFPEEPGRILKMTSR